MRFFLEDSGVLRVGFRTLLYPLEHFTLHNESSRLQKNSHEKPALKARVPIRSEALDQAGCFLIYRR
jgi:hypothetical protein